MKKLFSIFLSLALVLSLGALTAAPAMAVSPPTIAPESAIYDLDNLPNDISVTINWNGAATITGIADPTFGALVLHTDYEVYGDTLIIEDIFLSTKAGPTVGLAVPGDQTVLSVTFDDVGATVIDILITAAANVPTISPASAEFDVGVPADVSTTIDWGAATMVITVDSYIGVAPWIISLTPNVDYIVAGDTLTILQSWLLAAAGGNITTKDQQVLLGIVFLDAGFNPVGYQEFVITSVGSANSVNPIAVNYDVDDPPTSLTTVLTTDSAVIGIDAYYAYPGTPDPYYPNLAAGFDYVIAGDILTITNNYLVNVIAPTAAAGVPMLLEITFAECNLAFLTIWPVSDAPSFLLGATEYNLSAPATTYEVVDFGSATTWAITGATLNGVAFPGVALMEIYGLFAHAPPLGMYADLISFTDVPSVAPAGLFNTLTEIGSELVVEFTFDDIAATVLYHTVTASGDQPELLSTEPFAILDPAAGDVEVLVLYGSGGATTVVDVLDADGVSIGGANWAIGTTVFSFPNAQAVLSIDAAYLQGLPNKTVGDEVVLTVEFDSSSWETSMPSLVTDTDTLTIEFVGDCATISPDEVEWEGGDVCVTITYEGSSNGTIEVYNICSSGDWRDWCPIGSGNWTVTDRCPDPADCPLEKTLCIESEFLDAVLTEEGDCIEIVVEFNECFATLTICIPDPDEDGDGEVTCFIATAVYGEDGDATNILREFRDKYLLTNPVGKALVDLYYRVSPPVAQFLTEHPALQPMVRAMLLPAVALGTIAVNTSPAAQITMLVLLLVSVAMAVWVTRRRERGPAYV